MRCCVTGHRPEKLVGGYNFDSQGRKELRKILYAKVEELINNGYNEFLSGGALGVDSDFFCVCNVLKKKYPHIQNKLAIPFKQQSIAWNMIDAKRYEVIKKKADEVIYVDTLPNYSINYLKPDLYHIQKMMIRNQYMVDNSDLVIAVWNGDKKGGTYNCLQYAKKCGKEIIIINPNEVVVQ